MHVFLSCSFSLKSVELQCYSPVTKRTHADQLVVALRYNSGADVLRPLLWDPFHVSKIMFEDSKKD